MMQRPVSCSADFGVIGTLGAQIMCKDRAKLVILDLADIGSAAAQMGYTGNGVCRRPARYFLGRPDPRIKIDRALHVDQLHHALLHAGLGQKCVGCMSEHVDHRVPDADNLIFLHSVFSS